MPSIFIGMQILKYFSDSANFKYLLIVNNTADTILKIDKVERKLLLSLKSSIFNIADTIT